MKPNTSAVSRRILVRGRPLVGLMHGIIVGVVACDGSSAAPPAPAVFHPARPPDDSECEQAPGNHCETPAPSPGKFDEPRCKDRGGTVLDLSCKDSAGGDGDLFCCHLEPRDASAPDGG